MYFNKFLNLDCQYSIMKASLFFNCFLVGLRAAPYLFRATLDIDENTDVFRRSITTDFTEMIGLICKLLVIIFLINRFSVIGGTLGSRLIGYIFMNVIAENTFSYVTFPGLALLVCLFFLFRFITYSDCRTL